MKPFLVDLCVVIFIPWDKFTKRNLEFWGNISPWPLLTVKAFRNTHREADYIYKRCLLFDNSQFVVFGRNVLTQTITDLIPFLRLRLFLLTSMLIKRLMFN